jgi:hypothetical protein
MDAWYLGLAPGPHPIGWVASPGMLSQSRQRAGIETEYPVKPIEPVGRAATPIKGSRYGKALCPEPIRLEVLSPVTEKIPKLDGGPLAELQALTPAVGTAE